MKRLLVGFSVLVLTTLFATPLCATADEIRIVRGTLFQPMDLTGDLNVEGTSGVRIDAALNGFAAFIGWDHCDLRGCLPGDVLSLDAGYGPGVTTLTGSGQVTIHGQTYSLFRPDASADFQFDGTVVLPELTDTGTAEVSAPFAFSGSLQVPNQFEPGTYDVFELHGSGVATVTLVRHASLAYASWNVASVRYDFVPRGNVIPG